MLNKLFTATFLFVFIAGITSCSKKDEAKPSTGNNNTNKLEGGKGGDYNVVFFSYHDGKGASSRMFLKFAADKMPADSTQYDEKMNTMVEPGFGPHTHFNGLKKGTYFLYAVGKTGQADTVFTLTDSTKKNLDIKIYLK